MESFEVKSAVLEEVVSGEGEGGDGEGAKRVTRQTVPADRSRSLWFSKEE